MTSKHLWAKSGLQMQLHHNNNNNHFYYNVTWVSLDISSLGIVTVQITLAHCPHLYSRVLWKVFLSFLWQSLDVLTSKAALVIYILYPATRLLWMILQDHCIFHCLSATVLLSIVGASTVLPPFIIEAVSQHCAKSPCYSVTKCREKNSFLPTELFFLSEGSQWP